MSDSQTLPDPTVMQDENVSSQVEGPCSCQKIAVVDEMVVVQKLIKPTTVNTVKYLSECFNNRLMSLTREYDEVILVFTPTNPIHSRTQQRKQTPRERSYPIPNKR